MITQTLQLNLVPKGVWPRLYVSQYDAGSRTLTFEIYNGDQRFTLTSGTTAKIQGTKPDRHGFSYDADVDTSNNVITADITQQMTAAHGEAYCELVLFKSGQRIGTLNFVMMIQQAGLNDETDTSDSDLPDIIAEATEQMLTAEAYAKGTRNGTAVTSGQTGYHDNSKYYKEQAATQASNASTSATSANTNALKAEGYAVGKQNGTTQTSGTYYHNNAQYYKEQAASSATTASTKAGEASTSANTASQKASAASTSAQTASDKALVAEGYAKGTQNGTPVGSTSPYYHNNAEYFKDLANPTVAANVSFNNSGTEMSSTNVQDGIVENRTSIQNLSNQVNYNTENGVKNILPTPYYLTNGGTATSGPLTVTENSDGSVTINGTASAQSYVDLARNSTFLKPGRYILSGGKTSKRYIYINATNNGSYVKAIASSSSEESTFTIDYNGYNAITVGLSIAAGEALSNVTFYPMIRSASIEDDTYEPYAMTNQQLTKETTGLIDNTKANGCVNIFNLNLTSQVDGNFTYVVNDDKTFVISGTNGSSTYTKKIGEITFEPGTYKLTGAKDYAYLQLADSNWSGGTDTGNGYVFTVSETKKYNLYSRVSANRSVSNVTVKPMISLASMNLSYNDYVPYAKSNKELTENLNKGQILEDYIGTGDNGISVTGDGTKTLGTLLNELGTALLAKAQSLASNEYMEIRGLRVDGSWEVPLNLYQIFNRNSTEVTCDFASSILTYGNTGIYVKRTTVSSVANKVYANVATIKSSGVTFSTDKENVIGNGKDVKMFYRIYRRV